MPLTPEEEARYKQLIMERTAYEQQTKAMREQNLLFQ